MFVGKRDWWHYAAAVVFVATVLLWWFVEPIGGVLYVFAVRIILTAPLVVFIASYAPSLFRLRYTIEADALVIRYGFVIYRYTFKGSKPGNPAKEAVAAKGFWRIYGNVTIKYNRGRVFVGAADPDGFIEEYNSRLNRFKANAKR